MTLTVTLPRTQLLIDGLWTDAAAGRRFETVNPATEATLAEVAEGGRPDIDAAVIAARRALESGPWAVMTGAQRGRILNRLAGILRERLEEVVLLESLDAGKPLGRRGGRTWRRRSTAWSISPVGPTSLRARSSRRGGMR